MASANRLLQAMPGLGLILLGGVLLSRPDQPASPPSAQAPVAASESLTPPRLDLSAADFSLAPERDAGLFAQLSTGDRAWIPRAEPIPGGGIRYVYKKRADQPALTLDQIKTLMRHPPSFAEEQRSIRLLLNALRESGVRVVLGPPRKHGAAGEWEPAKGTLRIRPDIPAKGSQEFARVLNHEAIHVAQSCSNGSLRASPQPLGLPRSLDQAALRHLSEPLYSAASPKERVLEEEAYANQGRLSLGGELVSSYCRGD